MKTSVKWSNVPGAAGGDDGNVDGIRHRRGQLAVESRLRAVAIHRRQQDLTGAARLRLARPFDGVARRIGRSAADEDAESVALPLGVDRDDDRLAAVSARQRRDQLRAAQRRGVEADLVGSRLDGRSRIVFRCECRRRRSAAGRSRARRR